MSPDLVWPIALGGTAAVCVAITVAAEWWRHHDQRDTPTWWERDIRHRQIDTEVEQSKPTLR
jgi:hypothetical protein